MDAISDGDRVSSGKSNIVLEAVKLATSLSGVLALAFGVYQWRESNLAARDGLDQRLVAEWQTHLASVLQAPDVFPYLYERKTPVDDDHRARVFLVADMRLEVIDNIIGNAVDNWPREEIDAWTAQFQDAFRRSPVLCGRFATNSTHYDSIEASLGATAVCAEDRK
jgi:hypothetical protein